MFTECSLNVHKVWVLSPSGVLTASVRNVENFIMFTECSLNVH
jgi:hypothetical protein